jgi:hypothetical protein
MTQHTRTSFARAGEVLEHAIDYLIRIRDQLDALSDGELTERARMLVDAFAIEQRNLLGALERYAEDASDKVLDTFINYSVELPNPTEGPQSPLTTLGLTQWLLGCNQHLVNVFGELAESAAIAEAREAFAAMFGQLQAHDRRLSKEYQRFEDL